MPYIGDLIGYRTAARRRRRASPARAPRSPTPSRFRRRKGTAPVLEQLARDVTGWHARAVEFFELLATTQYMNHVRPHNLRSPDLRDRDALEWIGTPFDTASRTRRRAPDRARRRALQHPQRRHLPLADRLLPATRLARPCASAARRFRFSPLGHDMPAVHPPRDRGGDHPPRRADQRAGARSRRRLSRAPRPALR